VVENEGRLERIKKEVEEHFWCPSQEVADAEARYLVAKDRKAALVAKLEVAIAHRDELKREVGESFEREHQAWLKERDELLAARERLTEDIKKKRQEREEAEGSLAAQLDEAAKVERTCATFEQQIAQLPAQEEELRTMQGRWVALFEELQEKERLRRQKRRGQGKKSLASSQGPAIPSVEALLERYNRPVTPTTGFMAAAAIGRCGQSMPSSTTCIPRGGTPTGSATPLSAATPRASVSRTPEPPPEWESEASGVSGASGTRPASGLPGHWGHLRRGGQSTSVDDKNDHVVPSKLGGGSLDLGRLTMPAGSLDLGYLMTATGSPDFGQRMSAPGTVVTKRPNTARGSFDLLSPSTEKIPEGGSVKGERPSTARGADLVGKPRRLSSAA